MNTSMKIQSKMAVITGIKTGFQIALKYERRYRYLDITNKFIRKFVPPPYRENVRRIKDILITGGVISQLVGEYIRGFQKEPVRPNTVEQTRSDMERPGDRRSYSTNKSFGRRRPFCRQRRRY